MSSGPDFHGWTHRPKALGGTDPIDMPSIKTASMLSGLRSRSLTGGAFLIMDFVSFWTNDTSFGYLGATGSPLRAKWITISEPGLYLAQASTMNDEATPFSGTDDPLIEIIVYLPIANTQDQLINSKSEAGWDDGQSPIYGEMFTASEYAHQQMVQTIWFNWDPDWFAEPVVGIGVGLRSSNSVTKTVGGSLVISKLSSTELSEVIVT